MAAKTPEKFILATKVGMTQMYSEKGDLVGVTLLHIAKNVVTQVKTKEKDGYAAVQVSTGSKKAKNMDKGLRGHYKELGSFRWSREFRLPDGKAGSTAVGGKDLAVGDNVDVSIFAPGDTVRITGVGKGKGFAGAVKRHGFRGAPGSHGHHHVMRHVGSIGQRFPQHTLKGSRGPGRDGSATVTTRGMKVMAVEADTGLLAVKGAVPGANGSLVHVTT